MHAIAQPISSSQSLAAAEAAVHDFERVEGFPTRPHLLRSVKYKITHDPSHAAIKQKDEGHR